MGAVTDSVFVSPNALYGGQQQLTTTYGFRGGYTHNWDAYWNTGLYGAWAAVKYNNTAKALICVGVPGGHLGLGNFTRPVFSGATPTSTTPLSV